jgi:hypothetical protein
MRESRGFGAGDERLGRVLRDAMEGRGRPVTAPRTGAGERPRFGAMLVTAVLGGAVATALALWPAVSAHRAPAAPRTAVAPSPAAATLPAESTPLQSPADASAVAPARSAGQALPAPPAAVAPAPVTSERRPPTPAPATPTPLPPLTFANREVVGCCLALGGRWHDLDVGGQPGFRGPSAWTASHAATASWNLGSPAAGRRWDSVRVLVWIPNRHGRARVQFTITATSGQERAVRTFDVAEQGRAGWLTIPGTFSAGTTTERTGTITVRMSFLRPFTGANMAAGQAMFEWS